MDLWEKGDSPHLPERPEGCYAQMGTVPFSHRFLHASRSVPSGRDGGYRVANSSPTGVPYAPCRKFFREIVRLAANGLFRCYISVIGYPLAQCGGSQERPRSVRLGSANATDMAGVRIVPRLSWLKQVGGEKPETGGRFPANHNLRLDRRFSDTNWRSPHPVRRLPQD